MNHLKSTPNSKLFVWVLSLIATLVVSSKGLAQVVDLPQLEVHGLEKYRGQYLTTYFALGNPASIALSSDQVFLREVRAKSTQAIGNNSTLVTPKMTVVVQGFTAPYNLVVLVIHREPQYSWVNPNGSRPLGENTEVSGGGATVVLSWLRQELVGLPSGQNSGSYRIPLP